MNNFTIGPMRLERAGAYGPGWFLWRGNDPAGFYRDESEGRHVAFALSLLTDGQWLASRAAVTASYEREAAA